MLDARQPRRTTSAAPSDGRSALVRATPRPFFVALAAWTVSAIFTATAVAGGTKQILVPDGDVAALAAAIEAANDLPPGTGIEILLAEGGHYLFNEPLGDEAALPTIASLGILDVRGRGATIERSGEPGTPAFRFIRMERGVLFMNGLSFRNGDAGPDGSGGAMLFDRAPNASMGVSLAGLVLEGNRAGVRGGAIAGSGEPPFTLDVISSELRHNEAARGGAIDASGVATANCLFEGNTATGGSGGAIFMSPPFTISSSFLDCTFIENVAQEHGGAVMVDGACLLPLEQCTFTGNVAVSGSGGGVAMMQTGPGSACFPGFVWDCAFIGNSAGGDGGGMLVAGGDLDQSLDRNLFADNVAGGEGGGLAVHDIDTTATNLTFSGNQAGTRGGGVSLGGELAAEFRGLTIHQNIAGDAGSGVHFGSGTAISLTHTIISGGRAGLLVSGTYADEGWNIVEDGAGLTEPTSLAVAPGLSPLADNGGPTMTHALTCSSPARDGGDCRALDLSRDQRFRPRPVGRACDIGAYEVQFPQLDVDCDGAVGVGDLLLVLAAWGPCPECPEDVDGNGHVDFADLLEVLATFET